MNLLLKKLMKLVKHQGGHCVVCPTQQNLVTFTDLTVTGMGEHKETARWKSSSIRLSAWNEEKVEKISALRNNTRNASVSESKCHLLLRITTKQVRLYRRVPDEVKCCHSFRMEIDSSSLPQLFNKSDSLLRECQGLHERSKTAGTWGHLAQDEDQWWVSVNPVMNFSDGDAMAIWHSS
jgi:hypothetical protein